MTEEDQRIALAEACGWTGIHKDKDGTPWGTDPKTNQMAATLPDYTHDLNAMHEAIMFGAAQSGFGFQALFQLKLQEVVERRRANLNREQIGWWMNNATASQRAEGFLRTLGKWIE